MKMNISGGMPQRGGSQTFAPLCSALSTARKQGKNIARTLTAPLAAVIMEFSGSRRPRYQSRTGSERRGLGSYVQSASSCWSVGSSSACGDRMSTSKARSQYP